MRNVRGLREVVVAGTLALTALPAHPQVAGDPLARPVALTLTAASIADALRAIAAGSGVRLSYSSDLLPPSMRVTVALPAATVGAALREVLRGTGLGVVVVSSGHVVVLPAPVVRPTEPSASPVALAARKAVPLQSLDRVIVMGTPAAGAPEREVAVSVTVVDDRAVREDRPASMADLFRSAIPGIVAWDLGVSGPVAQVGSVRGSSSFTANYLKAYLDGVELASPHLLFAIDPELVSRLEVIRGPQGSAMYGSDAISGVAHVVTSKGTLGAPSRTLTFATSLGAAESEYITAPALAGRHFLRAGGSVVPASLEVAATTSHVGAIVDGGGASSATLLAGGRALAGPILLEGTARATRLTFNIPLNPELAEALGPRTAPRVAGARTAQAVNVRTLGLTALHEPAPWLRQSLIVGFDGNSGSLVPQRNPASVADALLGASEEDAARASLRYSSSLRRSGAAFATTLTLGAEWSRLERERTGPSDVVTPGGSPFTAVRRATLYIDTVSNSGAFAQWKLDIRGAFFLQAGVRGERSSAFGAGYGTAWSPAVGAAMVRDAGDFTAKLRGAFGRGIRPPPPSARRALTARDYRQLPNPNLAPEEQEGVEAGVELHSRGAFILTATVFDQVARGLVQHVQPDPRQAPRAIQQQNVGRITNRGVELSLSAVSGVFEADASLGTVASRVAALSPSYTGELRVGDAVPDVPEWTASAALRYRRRGTVAMLGVTALGAWRGYDWLGYYTAAASADPQPALSRYSTSYSPSLRPSAGISHETRRGWAWFARVENLGGAQHASRDNLQVTAGRTTWVGVRVGGR
jgi:iron complex outermembrane receptor protein